MKKSRSGVDFKKHQILITEADGLLVHHLKLKDSYTNSIKFINTNGIMAVTGDFGNWIFCREFHPANGGKVSDGYWCEKLRTSSTQQSHEYDAEATEKQIKYEIRKGAKEYGYKGEQLEEYKEYLTKSLRYIDDELEYTHFAYREYPPFLDAESVIYCKKIKIWVQIIFDAFDYICSKTA